MIKIPTFARIGWNTFDDKIVQRDDQESIFLATFDDFESKTLHKHQIDYSYYNRGRFEAAPKFILHVYSFGQDSENYSDTVNYFDKEYDNMDDAVDDINHWLQFFQEKVTNFKIQKAIMAKTKKSKKTSISTISLNLIFKKGTPQYILDFFTKGVKHVHLPSVLYDYDFKFKNKPNFSGNTTMFCEKKKGRYYLSIYHKFDFETQGAEGYWFVGGLAQYAENDDMAGYVKHTFEDAQTQVFGFRDGLCFWKNEITINFNSAKYKKPDLTIREMTTHEIPFLEDMLHQAIFTPEGSPLPEKSIIFEPFLHHYIKDFGQKHDFALVAEFEGKLIGAIWSRLFSSKQKGYGFVDAKTPELSMAIDFPHRNSGVGAILLHEILEKLKKRDYKKVSLSVDMRNFAFPFYKKMGFKTHEIKDNSAIMVHKF
jgi:[ribosomal protein S18]-alanine N-acetyltransferase